QVPQMVVSIDNIAVIHPVKSFVLPRHVARRFPATVTTVRG
ncbi:uncharacterized protein METZ01_LOCUS509481, partial [marine metagenome]